MRIVRKPIGPVILAVSALALAGCRSPEAYLERGNQFYKQGKYADAAIQYQKAIQRSDHFGPAYYGLGQAELKQNHPVQAFQALRHAVDAMPEDHDALTKLGEVSLTLYSGLTSHPEQLYEQANSATKRLLAANPQDFDGNALEGAIALMEKKPGTAVGYLRKAVAAKPADLTAKIGLARALAQNGQVAEGVGLAQEVIRTDAQFGPAYDFLYSQYKADDKTGEAENILKLKVARNPKVASYVLQLAAHYAQAENPNQVASTLRILLDNPKDFPNARMLVGDFYNAVGRPEDAMNYFAAGAQSGQSDKNHYRIRMARTLAAERQWPAAMAELEQVLKDEPDNKEAKAIRALIWVEEGKAEYLDRAIAELKAQVKQDPSDAPWHYEIGNGLAQKGDLSGAQTEWKLAAGESQGYLQPRFALVRSDLAIGKVQEGLAISEEMLKIAPGNLSANLAHVACLAQAGRTQEAKSDLSRLAKEFPRSTEVRIRMGMMAITEHNYKAAETIFRELEGTSPQDLQVLNGLAQAYAGQHEPAKAIQLLEEQVRKNPGSIPLRETLAGLAATFGQYDVALKQYSLLAAAEPEAENIRLAEARVTAAKGNLPAAIEILKKTVEHNPNSAPARLVLAEAYADAGENNEAKASYRRVLEMQPDNARALNDLAYLMAESGENLKQAVLYAERARRSASDAGLKGAYSDTLGWVYLKNKQNDDALRVFQGLVESYPRNATYLYHYGVALYQNKEPKQARTELEEALASRPGSADRQKIRELLAKL